MSLKISHQLIVSYFAYRQSIVVVWTSAADSSERKALIGVIPTTSAVCNLSRCL